MSRLVAPLLVLSGCLLGSPAWAETLEFSDQAPWWVHLGARAVLLLHIAGGAIGIVSGWIASASAKGRKLHRFSGRTFFFAMLVSYSIAACVAPFLDSGARANTLAALLALYLLFSGVSAARRRRFEASHAERVGLLVAILVTGMAAWFGLEAIQESALPVDGSPPEAFAALIIVGLFAILGEARVLVRGHLSGADRVKRHLWRLCASFFVASGSLFVGQSRIFPDWFNATALPDLLAFAPVIIMAYFLLRRSGAPKAVCPGRGTNLSQFDPAALASTGKHGEENMR